MLRYIQTENTSKAKPNESAFSKTLTPKALSSQELIFYSMLPNKTNFQQWCQRLGVGKYLLLLGLKADLVASIHMLSTFPLLPQKTYSYELLGNYVYNFNTRELTKST